VCVPPRHTSFFEGSFALEANHLPHPFNSLPLHYLHHPANPTSYPPPDNGLVPRMLLASAFNTIPPSFLPSLRLRPRPGPALNSQRLRPWLLVHRATRICTPTQLLQKSRQGKTRMALDWREHEQAAPSPLQEDPIQQGKYHRKTEGKTCLCTGTLARSKHPLTAEISIPKIEGLHSARWN